MTNRRGYPRFDLPTPADAVLRLVRDVSVTQVGPSEFLCLGGTRCSVGDVLTLEVPGADTRAPIRARVMSSRPVVVNGALRNELRLVATGEAVVRHEDPSDGDARRVQRV
jgi:hypothetical protein